MQQLTGQAYVERYGHAWNVAELARDYVAKTDQEGDERTEAFRIMTTLVPFGPEEPIRVLDIGTGQGTVASVVLDAFPNARAVGLDVSEPMRDIASERMARYGDRFRYQLGDFVDGDLPADLGGPFDVIVSSKAIHHLPAPKKQLLYRSIHEILSQGGCFFDLDSIAPSDPVLAKQYRSATRLMHGLPAEEPERANRGPSAGHYFLPLDEQLDLLRNAGFGTVDCFWKRLRQTLVGGYKS
jgi:SAM-dependent methyltransferase